MSTNSKKPVVTKEKESQITFKDVVEKIHPSLAYIGNCDFSDFSTNYNISRNIELSERINKSFIKFKTSHERKHLVFDLKTGNIKLEKLEDGRAVPVFKSYAEREKYENSIDDLMEMPISEHELFKNVSFKKIKMSEIKKYNEEMASYNKDEKNTPKKPLIAGGVLFGLGQILIDDISESK